MEESYETFEEELGPSRAEPPPQKPVRQIRRPEMYVPRKIREDMMPVSQQLRSEPKILPKEPSFFTTASLHKSLSIQNLTQVETPWESVTLNRCLFVAITILVLTSGFQRLSETIRGQRPVDEEEDGLMRRPLQMLHNRGQPQKLEKSLWEVMFWWLPDLDDDEGDDEIRRGRSKRGADTKESRTHRNRPFPGKKLLKQRDGKLKDRRARKRMNKEMKDEKRVKTADMEGATTEDRQEETAPEKIKSLTKKKENKQKKNQTRTKDANCMSS